MALIENLLGNIVPLLFIFWLVYNKERREKIKSGFHKFMRWIETGKRP